MFVGVFLRDVLCCSFIRKYENSSSSISLSQDRLSYLSISVEIPDVNEKALSCREGFFALLELFFWIIQSLSPKRVGVT